MENKYYVVDIDCTGNADIVTTLPEEFWFLIAECSNIETANNEVEKYKTKVQEEIDKITGNYGDEDYVPLTQEDYDLDEEED